MAKQRGGGAAKPPSLRSLTKARKEAEAQVAAWSEYKPRSTKGKRERTTEIKRWRAILTQARRKETIAARPAKERVLAVTPPTAQKFVRRLGPETTGKLDRRFHRVLGEKYDDGEISNDEWREIFEYEAYKG